MLKRREIARRKMKMKTMSDHFCCGIERSAMI